VLAIVAAKLGWSPVLAVDVQAESVEATRMNAEANEVAVSAEVLDLVDGAAPSADMVAANVPPFVHAHVAASLPDPLPEVAILSGFTPPDRDEVLRGYGARGLRLGREVSAHGWTVVRLERDLRTSSD
jgi:ribosomal protein L11 methyltransferase